MDNIISIDYGSYLELVGDEIYVTVDDGFGLSTRFSINNRKLFYLLKNYIDKLNNLED